MMVMGNFDNLELIDIWHLAQNGERSKAKIAITHMLREQPECIPAWLLLAEFLDIDEEKAKCYQQILDIDPCNENAVQFFETIQTKTANSNGRDQEIPDLFDEDFVYLDPSNDEILDLDEEYDNYMSQDAELEPESQKDDLLIKYIVNELCAHVDEDAIIREVSLRGQLDWYEAVNYVGEIKDKYGLTIAKRRSPLLLILAVPTLIAGLIWFVITGFLIVKNGYNTFNLFVALLESIQHFVGSTAMILGGAIGIYRVLKSGAFQRSGAQTSQDF
jgi:hypothetical protein